MSFSRRAAMLLGGVAWIVAAMTAIAWLSQPAPAQRGAAPLVQLWGYWAGAPRSVALEMPAVPARRGDPIFCFHPDGDWVQAGYLTEVDDPAAARRVRARWHCDHLEPNRARWIYHYQSGSLAEILETLLPPSRRASIAAKIEEAAQQHGSEVTAALLPLVEESLRDSAPVVEAALREAVAEHREEFLAIGERMREELLEERILPLIREEVLPTVRRHGEPLAEQIGRELWSRASLWRLGWRALYDRAPLPERELLRKEWERFIEQEAIPILQQHLDEIIQVQMEVLGELAQNRRLRRELGAIASELADDPELEQLLTKIVHRALIDNRALRQAWSRAWQTERGQAALRLASNRIEPLMREITEELFGTPETGIHPDFARVLRNQVLGKDRRWLVALPADAPPAPPPLSVQRGGPAQYPLLVLADPDALPAVEQSAVERRGVERRGGEQGGVSRGPRR